MRPLLALLLLSLGAAPLGAATTGAEPVAQVATADVTDLVEEKARDTYGPAFPQNGRITISFQTDKPQNAVMFSGFWMDTSTGQFVADVVRTDGPVVRIAGLAIVMVDVPVPARRMMPDEIVRAGDLQTIEMPWARVGAFAVTDSAELEGMQVRRMLQQGRPVMLQSVMQPLVIGRGDKVSIRYNDGLLALSAPGRALQDAHRGQELRIVNLVSNTSLTGTATGEGIVEVTR
ncbi:flagellar basal body P-ring formation chaperone FlgA [Pseudooceanicola nanhaiensis]|uniref:flagellar basal body P-ring formation chaperone FlgA n=1 Tax=Pseudooceanicola nanhaiensis TaxID=375761 RepID=UPI001CD33585|nr:flagellar basal body P-ring formation chaperone FlgA [Pseudooceanicola nanhaiensis]MCA0922616.1 flagellar basal body P-ring formation chaperone FlgA [Pseudooceanicola nanhaiensis]